ncbi:MAG: hypothetical protein JWR72_1782 [Flavisolibacter sp.]|nr:hypothetical protein [Flavisolibacter sp.]
MRTLFAFAAVLFCALSTEAQERWTVQLNSKVLLTAKTEDEAVNVIAVKDLKKGSLIVTYIPGKVAGERKRRLMVYDSSDSELYSKESFSISIPVASLKKWKIASPQIKIYTIPVLGEAGATVRLRRVHLCTINFE